MILYLDTSSLVKLYVEESGTDVVRGLVSKAAMAATCRVALPEAMSAFTRRFRSNDLSLADYQRICSTFMDDWRYYAVLDFDEREAASLVRQYALRGFNAVHLSAAKLLTTVEAKPPVLFSSFDIRLNEAANQEGIMVHL